MDVAAMTGLELLEAMAAGDIPPPTIATVIPIYGIEAARGRIVMRARADGRHLNPMGGVHGGFAATVLDSVTGSAVHSMLEAGVGYGTVDLGVKMLRPVPRDVELIAEGRIVHVSRSLGVADGTLRTLDGTLLATASATCFIQRRG